jgi:hypothetical protein
MIKTLARRLLKRLGLEFHCIEPDPALAGTLMRKLGSFPRVHVVQAALGDVVGKAKININVSRLTNSL